MITFTIKRAGGHTVDTGSPTDVALALASGNIAGCTAMVGDDVFDVIVDQRESERERGPIKFSGSPAAEGIWLLSMDGGADDEVSDDQNGYAALLRAAYPRELFYSWVERASCGDAPPLSLDGARDLLRASGAIIYVSSDGFVDVETYDSADELSDEWDAVVDSFEYGDE